MDFLLRARSSDDDAAEQEIRYNNFELASKRLIKMRVFTMREIEEEMKDARLKTEADIKFRRLMVIPYLIFAGILTYYECSTLLDYFEWLPFRIACYGILCFYPFYCIVYKRFTYNSWCIGWIAWNAPLMLFNFGFPPKEVQVSEQYLATIILLTVLRSAVYLFTGDFVKFAWKSAFASLVFGLVEFIKLCSTLLLEWLWTQAETVIRDIGWALVPCIIIAGFLTYYECLTMLDCYERFPVRVAACCSIAFVYPFSCSVLYPPLIAIWIVGWAIWNVPVMLFNVFFPPMKIQDYRYEEADPSTILLFIVLRIAFYQFICPSLVIGIGECIWECIWECGRVKERKRTVIDRNGRVWRR